MESAELDIRPRLDFPLHLDGSGRVARLATGRIVAMGLGPVRHPVGVERVVVVALLRVPLAWTGLCRDHGFARGHRRHDHCFLAEVVGGGDIDAAVSGLGCIRHGVELHDLAAEWVSPHPVLCGVVDMQQSQG